MPLLARRAASATERTLVYFRMNMYIRPPCVSVPAPRIKAYRAAAGLGPTSEMGQSRGFDARPATSGLPQLTDIARPTRLVRFVPTGDINCRDCGGPFTRRTRTRSTGFRQAQALVAQGRRALGRNHLRHDRRNPQSIYAHRMRQLFPKLTLCPILKASCSSLRPARARPAVSPRPLRPLPLRPRPLRLH